MKKSPFLQPTDEIKKFLKKIEKDYLQAISRIKLDLENYHEAAFNKFIYQFHMTLSKILKISDNLTIDELGDEMKNLSATIYNLSKTIKEKEDLLLKEKNKLAFEEIQKEIKEIKKNKLYFGIIEKNIAKNNLVFILINIVEKINWIGFSGEKVNKEEATKVILNSENYIQKLINTDLIKKHKMQGVFSKIFEKNKNKNNSDSIDNKLKKNEEEKMNENIKENSIIKTQLNQIIFSKEDEEFINNRVGDEHFKKYSKLILNFIKNNNTIPINELKKIFINKGWNNDYLIPTLESIKIKKSLPEKL